MRSVLAEKLSLKYSPVAIFFTDEKPDGAVQFMEGKRGCVIAMLTAAAKGRVAVFDRKSVGCIGGTAGLCFGNAYEQMPGGIEYFLSTGRGEGYMEGEGYLRSPEVAQDFVDSLPYTDIAQTYVVFKPLHLVDEAIEKPEFICLYANPDQLSALTVLSAYNSTCDIAMPFGAGCQSICLMPYAESQKELPRAIVGLIDITARPLVPADVLSFTVNWTIFKEMESYSEESECFLNKHQWADVVKRMV